MLTRAEMLHERLLLLEIICYSFYLHRKYIFKAVAFLSKPCDGGERGREIDFKELGLQKLRVSSVLPTGDEIIMKLDTFNHSTVGIVCACFSACVSSTMS